MQQKWISAGFPSDMEKAASNDDAAEYELPSNFDMRVLDDVRADMLHALENGQLAVSAASIDRISTLSIQLLLSAGRMANETGASFSIRNPSEAFIASVKMLGLLEELEKWMDEE